ncbi:MAG: 4-hydroxy-3-methylbut-2-enyl diphosphate reductase [Burkholderiales bacterium]|nr:4-hydroxy-3-methylbut-2-enyl diphosphate reductase [Burkholderiales bacterium]
MELVLANPRGFCAGVDRAIRIVELALELYGRPLYVRHAIVHNRHVVDELSRAGAIFVESLEEVPDGSSVVFSAHGVAPGVWAAARRRELHVVDATCPLVAKVHLEVERHARAGASVLVIGHRGHVEVEGTCGHFPPHARGLLHVIESEREAAEVSVPEPDRVAYVTQTTLSLDDVARIVEVLRARFPALVGPRTDDICYATQNRQTGVRQLAQRCDVVLVVGAAHSSNSMRMKEVGERAGAAVHLIEDPGEIDFDWFRHARSIGLTASASAPEALVAATVERLQARWPDLARSTLGEPERISFRLPRMAPRSATVASERG